MPGCRDAFKANRSDDDAANHGAGCIDITAGAPTCVARSFIIVDEPGCTPNSKRHRVRRPDVTATANFGCNRHDISFTPIGNAEQTLHLPFGFAFGHTRRHFGHDAAGIAFASKHHRSGNRDPYGAGWMARGAPLDWEADAARLVDAAAYIEHIRAIEPAAEVLP